jgi:hypothetical protein
MAGLVGSAVVVAGTAQADTSTASLPLPPVITPISAIQGTGATSPLAGQAVTVDAIVTSLFERQDVLDGFFVQTPDADADADPATSEGIFVFCRGACPSTLATGDRVAVDGVVGEFFGMTQVSATTAGATTIISSGNPLPTPTAVALPAPGSTRAPATFESLEGMIVTFPQTLVVSEYFQLARFGEVVLTETARPYQFTHLSDPSVDGYAAFLAGLATRRIVLDDDNNDNNDAITNGPDEPYPYPSGGLSVDNRLRGGETIDDLTGVLHWSFAGASGTDAWRIRPIDGVEYRFDGPDAAPELEDVGGTVRVASFNVLNYFTTIDETSSSTTGPCGPAANQDCRGADSIEELDRQRAKIVAALAAIDADVVGLIEIQNDDGASTIDLVDALNAATAPGTYAAIDTGTIGTDAIKVALVYQPAAVSPVGEFAILDASIDPAFIDTRNRPALVQTFDEVATGERFTVAVNHFKSKGSACSPDDPDLLDGQGNCNLTRTAAANALASFLATDPTASGDPDVLIIGDLNAYRQEDPITALEVAGYTDLVESFEGDDAYSFLFDGQLGYLDHALANESLSAQVTGVTTWHINADEVPLFDYNDGIATVGEASFERKSSVLELYAPDALRSSDHDPLVVGLDLDSVRPLAVDRATLVLGRSGGGTAIVSGSIADDLSSCPTVSLVVDGFDIGAAVPTRPVGPSVCVSTGGGRIVIVDLRSSSFSVLGPLPQAFALADDTVEIRLGVGERVYGAEVIGRRFGRVWLG